MDLYVLRKKAYQDCLSLKPWHRQAIIKDFDGLLYFTSCRSGSGCSLLPVFIPMYWGWLWSWKQLNKGKWGDDIRRFFGCLCMNACRLLVNFCCKGRQKQKRMWLKNNTCKTSTPSFSLQNNTCKNERIFIFIEAANA